MELKHPSTRTMILAGFLLAALFLVLSHDLLFSHYFWDDDDFIYVSAAIEHSSPAYIIGREHYVQMFPRPVTHLYFWLISLLAGAAVWPYYLANLLLYAASSVLVFHIVRRLSGGILPGACAGLFYLFSPCANENIYWAAAGATGFLSGFLVLLTAVIYLHPGYLSNLKLRVLSLLTAVLALGTKESALSLPLILTLLEFIAIRSRDGRWKRLIPFYLIALLFALNVLFIQFSYADKANLTRYGLSWMIPRNLVHFVFFPLVGAMPPNMGEYTLFKMIFYPLLWSSTLLIGPGRPRRLMLLGVSWIAVSSLPFLPWIMDYRGFFPRICDIASRYFNIPSMGASMVVAAFVLALRRKAGSVPALLSALILLAVLAAGGLMWTHEQAVPMIEVGRGEKNVLDLVRSCWNGSEFLYIGAFGLSESRIAAYNTMYFGGRLIQREPLPANVPVGTRMLVGPKTSPRLYVLQAGGWSVARVFESVETTPDTRNAD